MELTGESLIAAPRAAVWAALNDETVLARCIDGVESLNRVEDASGERFEGRMNARVGPVRAVFNGSVALTEVDPPQRYVLVGEGKGGVAGFAKGQAEVVLDDHDGGTTRLRYTVTSSVGGKLAQLGSRLIEGAAKGYAATFFERFKAIVEAPAVETSAGAATPVAVAVPPVVVPEGRSVAPLVWGSGVVLGVALLLIWLLV